jgi:nitrogenase molybdenum-iron protein beta chain
MAFLRHTTAEIKPRKALTVNAAKTCQPVGAMYAALGVHRCLPHSHGSQGCCSYHRSALTRHYKEPIMAATSSFTEGSSVFGGQSNLLQAINTIFTTYDPDIIAVHTTCLSETIGDDIPQIISKAKEKGDIPDGKLVVHANTPSYVGAHVTGFANMVTGFLKYLAESEPASPDTVNVLPGWVEPSDMREIKRIVGEMGMPICLLPDTSDVLDAPLDGERTFYPEGGTRSEDIRRMGGNRLTMALGSVCSKAAADCLTEKCGVPNEIYDLPIGLKATDRFVDGVRRAAGGTVPKSIANERGRLVDVISDMHQYLYKKRVALVGDPDQLVSLAEFLADLDMQPVYIVTGTPGKAFLGRIEEKLNGRVPDAKVAQGQQADMFLLHQWIKQESVDLLIGNSYCKYISRDEDIPFIRHGFPVMDRVGHSYFPTVGYAGAMRLLEQILDAILTRQDRDAPEESFELVM